MILSEWMINEYEMMEIADKLNPLIDKLSSMRKLNFPSLNGDILEHEIIVGQLKLKLDTLNKEQRKYIEQNQKEISDKDFPKHIQKYYLDIVNSKRIYNPTFKIIEVESFESLLGKLS